MTDQLTPEQIEQFQFWRAASRTGSSLCTATTIALDLVLALSLALVTANTITGYFLHWGTWSAFVTYGLILLAIVVLDVAFIRERRRLRREQWRVDTARKDHTIRKD